MTTGTMLVQNSTITGNTAASESGGGITQFSGAATISLESSIVSGSDVAVVGDNFNQNANRISGCNPNSGPHSRTQWFDTHCFLTPFSGTFGNAGRNSTWGPGGGNWDFALYKNGAVTERLRYQFRTEFFNVLNHPSFNCDGCIDHGNSNTLGDSSFGQPTGTNDPREIQLALRFMF